MIFTSFVLAITLFASSVVAKPGLRFEQAKNDRYVGQVEVVHRPRKLTGKPIVPLQGCVSRSLISNLRRHDDASQRQGQRERQGSSRTTGH